MHRIVFAQDRQCNEKTPVPTSCSVGRGAGTPQRSQQDERQLEAYGSSA